MDNRRLLGAAFAALLLVSACGSSGSDDAARVGSGADERGGHQIIFDYSPTLSDVSTLMYLTQHPDVDLLAVTLAGTGESHCEEGVANTIALLELVGLPDVPVACGRTSPIEQGNSWPAAWRERSDELVGLDLSTRAADLSVDAADLMADIAAQQSAPVTIIAVGPLTNLAAALQEHDDLTDDVEMIYTMGGAFDVSGNAPNSSAEWNYYIDPTAVEIVFDSDIPVTVIPLDATNQVPVTRDWFVELKLHNTTAAATVVHDLLAATPAWDLGFDFWDELAAAAMLDPTLVTFENRTVSVVTEGEGAGRTQADADGTTVRVAMTADSERFERELLVGLNAGAQPPELVAATPQEVDYFDALGELTAELYAGIGELFESPESAAIDEFVNDALGAMTAEQEQLVRAFFGGFWSDVVELAGVHVAGLATLDVPDSLREAHEAYVTAAEAVIANEAHQLSTLEDLEGEALLGFLFAADPVVDAVDETCANLEVEAVARRLTVHLCSN